MAEQEAEAESQQLLGNSVLRVSRRREQEVDADNLDGEGAAADDSHTRQPGPQGLTGEPPTSRCRIQGLLRFASRLVPVPLVYNTGDICTKSTSNKILTIGTHTPASPGSPAPAPLSPSAA